MQSLLMTKPTASNLKQFFGCREDVEVEEARLGAPRSQSPGQLNASLPTQYQAVQLQLQQPLAHGLQYQQQVRAHLEPDATDASHPPAGLDMWSAVTQYIALRMKHNLLTNSETNNITNAKPMAQAEPCLRVSYLRLQPCPI